MANTKISALTALAGADVETSADVLAIVDTSVTTTKKILVDELGVALRSTQAEVDAGVSANTLISPSLNRISLGTEQASTSGTAIDFTSIPSGTRRITVMFIGVSTNGTSGLRIQIGDSGGVETSGYLSASQNGVTVESTSSFSITGTCVAASTMHGQAILSLQDSSDNTWVCTSVIYTTSSVVHHGAGSKATSAVLDRVRITLDGVDAFDAGAINISYER